MPVGQQREELVPQQVAYIPVATSTDCQYSSAVPLLQDKGEQQSFQGALP